MKTVPQTLGSALAMLLSSSAFADDCPSGSTFSGVLKKCVPDSNITVVIDPTWLVAIAAAIASLAIATFLVARNIGRVADRLNSQSRPG